MRVEENAATAAMRPRWQSRIPGSGRMAQGASSHFAACAGHGTPAPAWRSTMSAHIATHAAAKSARLCGGGA
ncbi:MAG: hypothetical protein HY922_15815 [Elusimicrobia bacterium]|nr:hypothetical protein [Elusimicrobiota bacterium]